MFADELRIDRVVVNLVNNAAQYAFKSWKIYLEVEDLDIMVEIPIQD